MPKSYKITFPDKFLKSSFQKAPFTLNKQYTLDGIPPEPQTKIYCARDLVSIDDFQKFIIEHEIEESVFGRLSDKTFDKYIRKEFINAFQSDEHNLLLLSGKKRYVLDFCKKTKSINEIKIQVISIDMNKLLTKLPHVKGVWFSFNNGLIRASALMGANIESTTDFQRYKTEGDISTLSFHYEFAGALHPIMVTTDGAIVIQSAFKEISDEISIIIDIHNSLLDDIYEKNPIK